MGDGFVGLDIERCEDLALLAGQVGTAVEQIAGDVQRWVWMAELVDVGAVARCGEIVEELGHLQRLLSSRAAEMEAALVTGGLFDAGSLEADRLLWASLLDDVGAGIDFDGDPRLTGGVPMSASIAAVTLARHLYSSGRNVTMSGQDVYDLVDDASLPVEVRAAALFALRNPDAFEAMFAGAVVTADSLRDFVSESAALATLATGWARFGAVAGPGRNDGEISVEELHAVAGDTSGRFTVTERDAATWLLEHDRIDAPWKDPEALTRALVNRQILAEHPDLAVSWVHMAAADPQRIVVEQTWYDDAGADAWLTAALSSTTDPQEQADLLVRFASIHQATKPDASILQVVHDLLDGISFVDPTQIADALNTAVYTAEGDYANAAASAAGMAIVFGGGKAIRLTADQVLRLAAGNADEFIQASLARLAREGNLTDDLINRAVADTAAQFDDDTARALRRSLERLAGDGGAWLDDAVVAKVPTDWPPGIANRDGVGTRLFDPDNPSGTGVRIDRGIPTNPLDTQQVDHVIVRFNGKVIGRDGRPIVGSIDENYLEAHIPLEEWVTWRRWYEP